MINNEKEYRFSRNFGNNLLRNTGIQPDDDTLCYIKAICQTAEPYRKIDSKGRDSAYFTARVCGLLITIVCSGDTHIILTAVIETHDRPQFRGK